MEYDPRKASPAVLKVGAAVLEGCLADESQALFHEDIVARVWSAMEREARKEARRLVGSVPPGSAVHHIDGDPFNNAPENLRLVSASGNRRRGGVG